MKTDREKLAAAIAAYDRTAPSFGWCSELNTVLNAARLHLETLPKTKKVWRVYGYDQKPQPFVSAQFDSRHRAAERGADFMRYQNCLRVEILHVEVPA